MWNNIRENKFRVWDFGRQKMFYPSGELRTGNSELARPELYQEFEDGSGEFSIQTRKKATLQYVGIRDKNSKEIYEGDILTGHMGYSPDTKITGVVEFSLETLNYVIRHGSEFVPEESIEDLHMVSGVEVIGNVFENGQILAHRVYIEN